MANAADWLLEALARISNEAHVEMSVTLLVGGAIVVGDVIPGRAYFTETATAIEAGGHNAPALAKVMADHIVQYAEIYPAPPPDAESKDGAADAKDGEAEVADRPPPAYVHLRNVLIQVGDASVRVPLWRGRISEVAGFSFGR